MYKTIRYLRKALLLAAPLIIAGAPLPATAAPSALDFSSLPPILSQSGAPMVLFGMSNDHQLYYRAYTDYDDLDGDGVVDTTYLHSFKYYGYFDSKKCYEYVTTNARFEPKAQADGSNYCKGSSSSYWSGNFLNWATMSRIDTVRKLLYGGLRSTDTASDTVLERSYLPNDAHSFAKFYKGADITDLTPFTSTDTTDGITLCNTTVNNTSSYSQNVTDAPLIRVAKGNFSLWAGNERWQCRWSNESTSPGLSGNGNVPASSGLDAASSYPEKIAHGLGNVDYIARIQACATGLIGTENCKQYPNGNYKPTGIIQKYGDDGVVNFGLMTGSYTKNKSGGVLRKNVGPITDEINSTSDGTFKPAPADGSIIDTLNRFRIYGYAHGNGVYNNAAPGDNCPWGLNSFNNNRCTNWGNPVAEILSECYRYYGGKTAAFSTDDSAKIAGLKTATWSDPLNSNNACSKLNVIMLNASTVSYDADELSAFDSDFGTNAENLTKAVGDGEGITGNTYFVGENGTDNNQLCTAKTVTNLGQVKGTCPDAPRLEGSYKMAGIAHYAHTNDIRSDLDGEQTVTTYGVALAPAVPAISIPVPGSGTGAVVNILPACRNTNRGNCAIVDFRITEAYQEDAANPGEYIGTLYVNWEDSEQGGDYDQDMWGTIKYRITSTNITVTTDVIAESTGYAMGFGYVISGTTKDGFHVHSGINNFTRADPDPSILGCPNGGVNCTTGAAATSQTYTLGASSAKLLHPPLYYAAKWGGFTDLNGDKKPLALAEWDSINNADGSIGSDGIPDNYFYATNPSQLESQLAQVLDNIVARTASGTNAAVVSNSSSGVGAVYQALYQPQLTVGNNTVEWVGKLHSLFIDDMGHLREDTNGDAVLDDYATDKIIKIAYSPQLKDTYFQRYSTADNGETLTTDGPLQPLKNLKTVWSAVDELAAFTNTQVKAQRSYTALADTGRYIFTAINESAGEHANKNHVVDFNFDTSTTTSMASNNRHRYMAIASTEAEGLVNYIRGDDSVPGSRNRTIDIDGTSTVWRLGDIVNSTPVVVGSPSAAYEITHSDTSYQEFVNKYRNRRQVVYVGANDGMLHAFNTGFWDPLTKSFVTSPASQVAHPLGAELWAYVPTNLLPHLQWLKQPNYPHVYYMDGVGIAQDVNIFTPSATHPKGWGTILVMGMRFGGGAMGLDTDGDSVIDRTTGSGYVIMDITDPEQAPVLLAEITAPEFGFTTSKPAIIKSRTPTVSGNNEDWDNPDTNEWTLVFGSGPHGPDAISDSVSDQNARIIQVDLKKIYANANSAGVPQNIYKSGFGPTDSMAEPNSFVGDITVTDWNQDLIDDVVYFGTSSGSNAAATGKLIRFPLSTGTAKTLVNTGKPIVNAPLTSVDSSNARWVMAGTGRLIVKADNSNDEQQYFIGVKEPQASDNSFSYADTVTFASLVDTTNVRIFGDGSLKNANGSAYSLGGDTITTFDEMKSGTSSGSTLGMKGQTGWKVRFDHSGTVPSGRSAGKGALDPASSGLFAFTEYVPPSQQCEVNGSSYLWSLSFETGTSTWFAPIGQDPSITNNTELASLNKISVGDGKVGDVTYFQSASGGGLKLVVTDSTGGIDIIDGNTGPISTGRQSWRQIDTSKF